MYHVALSVAASPPSGVTAVQDGPTSIRVSWTPSSDATGYGITYTGGGSSDSVAVGDTNNHALMGLTNGESYTLSIVGTSSSSSGAMLRVPSPVGDVALGILSKSLQKSYFIVLFQFHQLHFSMTLQQSLPLPSESLAVFPVAQ